MCDNRRHAPLSEMGTAKRRAADYRIEADKLFLIGTNFDAAMEQELRQMKIALVSLNIFTHNSIAAGLYSKMGYAAVSTRMRKQLR